jgi:hypothetical protein
MRIRRVVAEAFGPLAGQELEPAPGMTVVWGTNETGKSTWHAAIYAALCGLRRGKGAPRKAERDFAARRRPWDDDRWRVQATAELTDGRTLEFYQDLDGKVDCRIRDAVLGTDLSDELMCDGSPDGAVLFGLTRQTLLATAWVGQADVLGVLDNPDALQESLQRAAATGGSDDTAEAALQRLQAFHRERVGTERRNSTKPLRQAIVAEQTAKAELDAAQQAHQEYLALVGRRDDACRAAEAAAATLRGAQATLAARRLAQAQRRHEPVAELAQEFADGPPHAPAEPGALDEQIAQALAAWQARPDEPAVVEGASADELEQELAGLAEAPEGDTEVAAEVAEAVAAWREAHGRLVVLEESQSDDDAAQVPPNLPEEATSGALREAADALEAPLPEVDAKLEAAATSPGSPVGGRVVLVGGAVAALAGAGLMAGGVLVAGAVLLVAGAGAGAAALLWWRKAGRADPQAQARLAVQQATRAQATDRRETARRQAEAWGVAADPGELRQLARRLDDRAHAAQAAERHRHEVEQQRAVVLQAAGRLEEALATRGAEVGEDLAASFAAYESACRQRARQANEAARAASLRQQLASRRQLEQVHADQRRRRNAAAQAIRDAAHAAALPDREDATLDELAEALGRWQAERQAHRETGEQAQRRWNQLQTLLDGSTVDQVEAELARRREEHAALADVEALTLPDEDGQAEAALRQHEEAAGQADRELAGLEAQLADHQARVPSVAEAEERLARAEAELARCRQLDRTLSTTIEFLEEARERVHRDIAPRLKHSVEARLATVTGGRYDEVRVNPADLAVRVRSASGAWRDATLLSHGAAEQVYLLLRVAMAEHLATTGEPIPLLLDEPTAQADRERTEAVLDLLHKLSGERQVILFSQEDEVRHWAQASLTAPDDALIHLDPGAMPA